MTLSQLNDTNAVQKWSFSKCGFSTGLVSKINGKHVHGNIIVLFIQKKITGGLLKAWLSPKLNFEKKYIWVFILKKCFIPLLGFANTWIPFVSFSWDSVLVSMIFKSQIHKNKEGAPLDSIMKVFAYFMNFYLLFTRSWAPSLFLR